MFGPSLIIVAAVLNFCVGNVITGFALVVIAIAIAG